MKDGNFINLPAHVKVEAAVSGLKIESSELFKLDWTVASKVVERARQSWIRSGLPETYPWHWTVHPEAQLDKQKDGLETPLEDVIKEFMPLESSSVYLIIDDGAYLETPLSDELRFSVFDVSRVWVGPVLSRCGFIEWYVFPKDFQWFLSEDDDQQVCLYRWPISGPEQG